MDCRTVDGFGNAQGTYRLATTCPTPVSVPVQGNAACSGTVSGNSGTGTNTVGTGTAPEHWYRFQAPVSGSYTFNSCGSSYDTYLHIFNRTGTSQRTSLVTQCDDCGPCGTRTVLTVDLMAGPYFVYVNCVMPSLCVVD